MPLPLPYWSTHHIYVGNIGNNSISVYALASNGNVAPVRTIAGPNTLINNPAQISIGPGGRLYVASSGTPAILVFGPGTNGNIAPERLIAGPATTLRDPAAVRVDPATGDIYVVDNHPNTPYARFLRFQAGANGNVPPIAQTGDDMPRALQIVFDSTGKHIIDAHGPECSSIVCLGVDTYPKAFKNGDNPKSIYDISILWVTGIADDPTTGTYLAMSVQGNYPTGIVRFDEDTVGQGQMVGPAKFTPPFLSHLTSQRCGNNLALDGERNIYAAVGQDCGRNSIVVYGPNATGMAAPLRQIVGPATGLNAPYGIDIGP